MNLVRNLAITEIQIARLSVNLSILPFLLCSFRILLITWYIFSLFGKQESLESRQESWNQAKIPKDFESRQIKSSVGPLAVTSSLASSLSSISVSMDSTFALRFTSWINSTSYHKNTKFNFWTKIEKPRKFYHSKFSTLTVYLISIRTHK